MALAIHDDHRALAEVVRSMLADRSAIGCARAAIDGAPEAAAGFWKDLVALGWLGLHVAERHGGEGYGLAELAIVAEELGRVAAPGPFLPTAAAAAAIEAAGTDEQRARWLGGLCDGRLTAGLALAAEVELGGGTTVSGSAPAALGARGTDLLLLALGDDLVVVESGHATIATAGTLDPGLDLAPVTLDAAPVAGVVVGGYRVARRVLEVLAAAHATGVMGACLEASVGYASVREQFGRPIGSFQAVKHHCAGMLVDTELGAAATWDACRGADSDDEADLVAAAAAGWALPAALRVAELTIQVHGGIAYTWEHDAHLYLRRAMALATFLGAPEAAEERVARLRRAGVRRRVAIDVPSEAEARRAPTRAFAQEIALVPEGERQVRFARSGYLVPHWPAPYGLGAGAAEQLVIDEELAGIERPSLGLGEWVVPTVLQHGTDEQKDRLLWPSLEGELRWCQLFSEPGAGSDAAAVRTRATKVDGGWLVNGQKVWTSDAMACQRGLATVRTNTEVPKHKGITAMVIDMQAPGVDIRPLTEITGETLFNEVFLDDVFVPDHDVLGAVDGGWRVARATLGNERVSIGGGSVTMDADALVPLLERHRPNDAGLEREVGALLVEGQALRALNLRHAARALVTAEPGIEGNLAKLFGAEHAQRVAALGVRLAGAAALVGAEPEVVHDVLFARCLTIAGGTSEVVRNQIAELILGLPREPRPA